MQLAFKIFNFKNSIKKKIQLDVGNEPYLSWQKFPAHVYCRDPPLAYVLISIKQAYVLDGLQAMLYHNTLICSEE